MNQIKTTYLTMVAFVGKANVGKSTLLNKLIGTKIAPTTRKPQTTRRIIRGIKTQDNCQQIYFDTPGIVGQESSLDRYMRNQIIEAIKGVQQVVVLIDATKHANTQLDLIKFIKDTDSCKRIIIAINKIDLLKDKSSLLGIINNIQRHTSIETIIPISAMLGDGINELFEELKKGAEASPFIFDEDYFTDSTEREIVAELIREKAMLELKNELPYKIAITVDEFNETRRSDEKKPLVEIEATVHVERKSQKPIVLGKGGATIKAVGTRARRELEHLLSCQVMLRLFVRVEPNWTKSKHSLRKFGY